MLRRQINKRKFTTREPMEPRVCPVATAAIHAALLDFSEEMIGSLLKIDEAYPPFGEIEICPEYFAHILKVIVRRTTGRGAIRLSMSLSGEELEITLLLCEDADAAAIMKEIPDYKLAGLDIEFMHRKIILRSHFTPTRFIAVYARYAATLKSILYFMFFE